MCPKSASKTLPLLLSSNRVDTNGPVNFTSKQPGINKLASSGFTWTCKGTAAESRSVSEGGFPKQLLCNAVLQCDPCLLSDQVCWSQLVSPAASCSSYSGRGKSHSTGAQLSLDPNWKEEIWPYLPIWPVTPSLPSAHSSWQLGREVSVVAQSSEQVWKFYLCAAQILHAIKSTLNYYCIRLSNIPLQQNQPGQIC